MRKMRVYSRCQRISEKRYAENMEGGAADLLLEINRSKM